MTKTLSAKFSRINKDKINKGYKFTKERRNVQKIERKKVNEKKRTCLLGRRERNKKHEEKKEEKERIKEKRVKIDEKEKKMSIGKKPEGIKWKIRY